MKLQFDSWAAFIAMNGHGPYVWAAYGITFACLAALVWIPIAQKRRFIREHHAQQVRMRKRGEQDQAL